MTEAEARAQAELFLNNWMHWMGRGNGPSLETVIATLAAGLRAPDYREALEEEATVRRGLDGLVRHLTEQADRYREALADIEAGGFATVRQCRDIARAALGGEGERKAGKPPPLQAHPPYETTPPDEWDDP